METIADFWFDPSCPYTWVTSRWMLEVETVRPVRVRWHAMSLSVLNEGREDDPEDDPEGYLWHPARVCAAVQEDHGQEALGRFYTALGARLQSGDWAAMPDALAEAGLPPELTGVAEATDYDNALRASHLDGVGLIGDHVGTPIIAVRDRGIAFFGPVMSRIPRGEDAGRLWDGTLLVAAAPGFHELKGRPHEEPEA